MSDHRRITKINPEVRIGNYIIGETLGTGSFGKVKVGIHRSTKVKVAIKIVNREKIKALDVAGKLRREIQNLWLFRHPHIIKLYQVISTPTDIFMIMEYVSGGELFDHIVNSVRLSEQHARKFFQQIISGVDYCHRHKVVHRDLKPENLLLDSNKNVKIADFGLSNIMQDGEFLRTSCGSPNYAAPEVISGKLYAGPEVDIWSCGVILYALLCGTLPFDDTNISVLFNKIKSGYFRMPDSLSVTVKDLIRRMLTTDPISRITIVEIKKHPWFVVDLPSHLFPQDRDEDASIIDKEAICEVCKACNGTEREVLASLISNDPSDQLSIAYNLIIDNKRFGSELNPDEVNNFYVATGSDSGSVPGSLQNDKMFPPDGHFDDNSSGSLGSTSQPGSANRPHPERMPAGLCLTRTLDPVDVQTGRKVSSNSPQNAASNQALQQSNTSNSNPNVTPTSASAMATGAATVAGMKRFKWHLGIRSQSKPWDIMHEVYKAMVTLGYEWKIINPFNIRVRRWNPVLNHYSKIMLQLYQVDVKSFLLDFKCIEDSNSNSGSVGDSVCDMNARVRKSSAPSNTNTSMDLSDSPQPASLKANAMAPSATPPLQQTLQSTTQLRHQTMEFFEMCTQLITALAR